MPEVVIGRCHGGWAREHGFTTVPDGTYLHLYNNGLNTMQASVADGMLLSSTEGIIALRGQGDTVGPGEGIYNFMTQDLSGDDIVWEGPLDRDIELIQGGWLLDQVFQTYAGSHIYWFACTSQVRAPRYDWEAADARNQAVLKALPDGGTTSFLQAGHMLLIGDGHAFDSLEVLGAQDYAQGEITIEKGGILSAGKLYVSGSSDPAKFAEMIARVSDKACQFQ
jgi:hypothetical protein